ncbi:hypothetical protein [Algicola sagamiensis]|uniref:hypothetical protein n=1 Tax=Algicola sagamiensis TaxID=163869 RepID=UPI00036D20B2|nr:hypothetical protein [Algicola sagamiensis]
MSQEDISDDMKRIFQQLLFILIIVLCFGYFAFYLNKNFQDIEATRLDKAFNTFSTAIHTAHFAWSNKARPTRMSTGNYIIPYTISPQTSDINKYEKSEVILLFTRRGWPISIESEENHNHCELLWQHLQNDSDLKVTGSWDGKLMSQKFLPKLNEGTCQFWFNDEPFFYYDIGTGDVIRGRAKS